ncbi:PepSY domain-containing protein [Marinimicrococcus flavescens]|uniref:PepSY domain-containing protein n=1 Tax=Marinimicrococcus flavescens TaxID=3031815 RepID=A0AAP3UZJ4_9PROT|nr:hypothetical protein [Marinimicrococcus flavescens]
MRLRAMIAAVALVAGGPAALAAEKADADAVAAARLSMVQAIEVVASEGKGDAVAATFKKDPEPGAYEVTVLREDTLVDYRLHAETAAIAEQGREAYGTRYARLPAAAIRGASLSLPMAIEAAEQRVGGKAASAMVSPATEKLRYIVEVLKEDGTIEEIKVDGALGLIVKE